MSFHRSCWLILLFALCQIYADGGFQRGKKYTYSYHATHATGVSHQKLNQFAGRDYHAIITLRHNDKGDLVFQIRDFDTVAFNTRSNNIQNELPYYMSHRMPNTHLLKGDMEKGFWVAFDNGKIKSISVLEETDHSVLNMKKALASLFQLKLDPFTQEGSNMYKLYEDGIGGDCKTMYNIQHDPSNSEMMSVIKTRLYDECNYRPHMFFSSISGHKCPHCEHADTEPLISTGHIKYDLKNSTLTSLYTIEKIESNGFVRFTPFTSKEQTITSLVNQTLILTKVEDVDSERYPIYLPGMYKAFFSFSYEFENDKRNLDVVELKDVHYDNRLHDYGYGKRTEKQVEVELLLTIETLNLNDISTCILPILEKFRKMSYDDFVYFFDNNVKFINSISKLERNPDPATAAEQNLRDLLMRVLPMTGTNPSVLFMLKLIQEEKMLSSQAINALSSFAFYVKEPSERLLDYLADIIGNETVRISFFGLLERSHIELESTFFLAFGTLVFKGCVKDDFNPHPAHNETYIGEEKCTKYVELLLKLQEEDTWPIPHSTFIKAISNTHLERTFPFLLAEFQYGHKRSLDLMLIESSVHMSRLAAIWGLWSFIGDPTKNEQIASASAAVFFNTAEDHQIRIYAFSTWIFAQPTAVFFSNLVDILEREQNDKVYSFIYQVLTMIANSTDPCYAALKQHARSVLKLVQPRNQDILNDGFMKHFSVFNDNYNFGRTMDFSVHPGNNSFFPRDIYYRQSVNLLGYNFDIIEAGLTGISRRVASDISIFLGWKPRTPHPKRPPILENIKGSYKYEPSPSKFREELLSHMGWFNQFIIYTHQGREMLAVSLVDSLTDPISLKAIENAFAHPDRNKDSEDNDYMPITFNFQKNSLGLAELEGTIPNEMGIPVVLRLQITTSSKMHGGLGLKLGKSNKSLDRIAELNVDWNFKTGTNLHLHGSMHVDCSFFYRSGYQIKTSAGLNFPLNATVKVEFEQNKLTTKYVPLPEPFDILHYDTKTETFNDAEILPVIYNEKLNQKTYYFGHDYFGLGLMFNFTYGHKRQDYQSHRNFFNSLFSKPNNHEDYFNLGQKLFAKIGNFLNHALFNPTGKPFHANVRFSPCRHNPTTEVVSKFIMEQADASNDYSLNATGWKYQIKVEARGPQPRTWSARFSIKKSWPYRNIRQVFFHFLRTTIPEIDKEPLEICFQSESAIENLSSIFTMPLSLKMSDIRWMYEASLKVGKSCEDRYKKIAITGVGQKSEMQQNINTGELSLYQQCANDMENGFQMSQSCWEVMKDMGRLDKFRFMIQYYNVTQEFKDHANRFHGWLRHTFHQNLEFEPFDSSNKEGQIELLANFSYFDPVVDVKIIRPDQNVFYRDIFLPSMLLHFEPISVTEYTYDRYLHQVFNYHKPLCILSGDYVRTFDNVIYNRPSHPNCYYLAFGNFRQQNGFVLIKPQSTKIHLSKDVIDITISDDALSLSINGQKQVIDDKKPFKMNLTDFEQEVYGPVPVCPVVIFKYYNGYVVNSLEHQLVIYYDGHNLKIQTSPYFFGHVTGLCGFYDGNKGKEFVSIDGIVHKNVEDFSKSYALLDDECLH